MITIAPFLRYARQFWADYEYTRTRRVLEQLPPHIRKDIGWPNGVTRPERRR